MISLNLSGKIFETLNNHLFPGDGLEAVAVGLCGRLTYDTYTRLTVHKLIPISYSQCYRQSDKVTWKTSEIHDLFREAARRDLAIVKFHSHPNGYPSFSLTDDESDNIFFKSVFGWTNSDKPHASVIMLPDGDLIGRSFDQHLTPTPIDRITVVGDDITVIDRHTNDIISEKFHLKNLQAFGLGTTRLLHKLKIGVIGCSGTGSVVIEQLSRLGVGNLVLVDPDKVEEKNLNRIINSRLQDAKEKKFKVNVIKDAIKHLGLGTKVQAFATNLYNSKDVIKEVATCDVIFGCVDSIDGRHLLNSIATFYLIPYFDLGVKLTADGKGGIDKIVGSVHYLQPGGSSLQTRGVYTQEELRAAGLFRTNPLLYQELRHAGYIVNVDVESPAVISVNMAIASLAVNEFLARIHKFRLDSNAEFAVNRLCISDGYLQHEGDGQPDEYLSKYAGRGDMDPFLNIVD